MALIKINNTRGNAFLWFIFCLAVIAGAGYLLYNNKDFQRTHRQEIRKFNNFLKKSEKFSKNFGDDLKEKIAEWKKSHPQKNKDASLETKVETRTFDDLIYSPQTLEQELPPEMIRHQPDEITVCAFNADFLLNNALADKELVHLANIFRFCDLSSITGLSNQKFLPKITTLLKILRYDASFESSDPSNVDKTIISYLYRNDRVQSLKRGEMYSGENFFSAPPYYKAFKVGDFDFIVATFPSSAEGFALTSIEPLENIYETIKSENSSIKDILIFGNFTFQSQSLSWDSDSLLPTFARAASVEKNESQLVGNFWFKKNDLIEFNGKSGIINIPEDKFSSRQKSSGAANRPIWTQFKAMPDDD